MNSRNQTTIATTCKHRQRAILHPTSRKGWHRDEIKVPSLTTDPAASSSALAHSRFQPLNYKFSSSFESLACVGILKTPALAKCEEGCMGRFRLRFVFGSHIAFSFGHRRMRRLHQVRHSSLCRQPQSVARDQHILSIRAHAGIYGFGSNRVGNESECHDHLFVERHLGS